MRRGGKSYKLLCLAKIRAAQETGILVNIEWITRHLHVSPSTAIRYLKEVGNPLNVKVSNDVRLIQSHTIDLEPPEPPKSASRVVISDMRLTDCFGVIEIHLRQGSKIHVSRFDVRDKWKNGRLRRGVGKWVVDGCLEDVRQVFGDDAIITEAMLHKALFEAGLVLGDVGQKSGF